MKKTAAESYLLLQENYGDHTPLQDTGEQWFWHFKCAANKEHGKPQKKYYELLKI